MSTHPRHLLLAIGHSRVLGVWDRARQLVARPRRSVQRLRLAVEGLHPDQDYIGPDWILAHRDADDVLRLLHRDRQRAPRRPGPGVLAKTRAVGVPQPGSIPRSGTTLGGWTLYVDLDASRHGDALDE